MATTEVKFDSEQVFEQYIKDSFKQSVEMYKLLALCESKNINKISDVIVDAYKSGNKVIAFGNGGSAADAQHFVAELVGTYLKKPRKPLEAIALTANTSNLTAIGNDFGYGSVFSRQIEAHGKPGDIAFGISTSGNSENVVRAMGYAKDNGLITIAFTGQYASRLSRLSDYCFRAATDYTPKVQETHITVIHMLCGLIEDKLELWENSKK